MMSKKDYEKFAELFKKWFAEIPHDFVLEFCDLLKEDNPKFDLKRFLKAQDPREEKR